MAYPVTYYPAATDPSGASVIAVAPGEKFTADVTLQPVPAVHAKLTVAPADSTEHFSATLRQQVFGDVNASLRTGAREISPGVLEISGIAPGNYTADINSYGDNKKSNTSSRELDMRENGEVIASQSAAHAVVSGLLKLDNGGELPGRGFPAVSQQKDQADSEPANLCQG